MKISEDQPLHTYTIIQIYPEHHRRLKRVLYRQRAPPLLSPSRSDFTGDPQNLQSID